MVWLVGVKIEKRNGRMIFCCFFGDGMTVFGVGLRYIWRRELDSDAPSWTLLIQYHFLENATNSKQQQWPKQLRKLTAIFRALQTMQPKDTWCPKVQASGQWVDPSPGGSRHRVHVKHQSLPPSNHGSGYDSVMMVVTVVSQFGLLSDLVFLMIVTVTCYLSHVGLRKISMYNQTRWLKLIPR